MAYTVHIRKPSDLKKIGFVTERIIKETTDDFMKKGGQLLLNIAQSIAQSWRLRVANAPYHKQGPFVRSGGRPLSQSIVITKLKDNSFALSVEDSGGNMLYAPPSAYSTWSISEDGRPLTYREEAFKFGMNRLNNVLKNL